MSDQNPAGNGPPQIPAELARYSRQIRFAPIGLAGQQRLARATALIAGCGALGSVIAESLVRSGVGRLRIVDRDFPELHNLQRQVLYTEQDVARGWPKAVAAASHLRAINSGVEIEPLVADIDHKNMAHLGSDVQVIVDGTDNFETRFLINDFSLETGIPWVYGGCLGAEGQSLTIVPGQTACLHCLMADGPPPPGTTPGCDLAGVVGPAVGVVASIQTMEAIKLLSGHASRINRGLTIIDLWNGRFRQMSLEGLAQRVNCPACQGGQRDWLTGKHATQTAILCGQDAVQIRGRVNQQIDLPDLARRLRGAGQVDFNEYLLRLRLPEQRITIFADGRAIISGTNDISLARSLYARWIGA